MQFAALCMVRLMTHFVMTGHMCEPSFKHLFKTYTSTSKIVG